MYNYEDPEFWKDFADMDEKMSKENEKEGRDDVVDAIKNLLPFLEEDSIEKDYIGGIISLTHIYFFNYCEKINGYFYLDAWTNRDGSLNSVNLIEELDKYVHKPRIVEITLQQREILNRVAKKVLGIS